jgi:hypothetical protein
VRAIEEEERRAWRGGEGEAAAAAAAAAAGEFFGVETWRWWIERVGFGGV